MPAWTGCGGGVLHPLSKELLSSSSPSPSAVKSGSLEAAAKGHRPATHPSWSPASLAGAWDRCRSPIHWPGGNGDLGRRLGRAAGLEPAWMPGRATISASGGRQWGAHQDSSSGAALCHRGGEGREGRRARRGPGARTARSAGSGSAGEARGAPGCAWHGPGGVGTAAPGPGQVCARTPVLGR